AGSDLTLHDEQRMTVNNDGWRMLFDTLFQLSASGVFPLEEPESTYRSHPFLSGDTAMTVMRDMDVFELKQLHEQAASDGDFNPFQWDIVTVPVHEHARDQGAGIAYEPI